MKRKTRSILEELNTVASRHDKKHVVESRGENIIASAINLLESIYDTYDEEVAADIERKLLNSIRNRSSVKFKRLIHKLGDVDDNQ